MIATYVSSTWSLTACFASAVDLPPGPPTTAPSEHAARRLSRGSHTRRARRGTTAVKLDGFAPTPELGRVHFDFDKAAVRPSEARILDQPRRVAEGELRCDVAIDGGADQRGSVVYNKRLSEQRAKAVRGLSRDAWGGRRPHLNAGSGEGLPVVPRRRRGMLAEESPRVDFLVKVDRQAVPVALLSARSGPPRPGASPL